MTRARPHPPQSIKEVRTLASQLADYIRHDIIRGELRPFSKLKLAELSKRYGAGVIPL